MMTDTKAGIGEVLAAYLEADRTAGAPARRERAQARGLSAAEEQRALLEIEESLESLSRDALGAARAASSP
jgi:hypothetical protein